MIAERGIPQIVFFRQLALKLNRQNPNAARPVHAGQLNLYATLQSVYRYLIDVAAEAQTPGVLEDALKRSGISPADHEVSETMGSFVGLFPPDAVLAGTSSAADWIPPGTAFPERRRAVLRELLLLQLAAENPALDPFRHVLDDSVLVSACADYPRLMTAMTLALTREPKLPEFGMTLPEILRAPIKAAPDSLVDQVAYIRRQWSEVLPAVLLEEMVIAFDILLEEERERGWGGEPGPAAVLEFGRSAHPTAEAGGAPPDGSSVLAGYDYPEYEQFSTDADWMSNVVLMAKMVYVWLDQLSRQHGYSITRLDQVPDAELDRLARSGFSGLWLIGIWERSPASQRIKQLCGNPDAIASAYSLHDYEISADLGGWEALSNLRERAFRRGIRLASDMVPNHTGIYSRWVLQHPDWFVQTDYPPFPTYQFNGEDLSLTGDVRIQIEDGYWTKSDAAVVFRYVERSSGRTRYIYHGNDGTSIPWNDTAQLNYLIPEVREAVIQTILHVARNFPIIRFDAAMTLAKKHFQRLWFPIRGLGGGIPSRAEHGMTREEFDALFPVEFWRDVVDRVAVEAPGTLLLAEAFWMMEAYFVRTLGMHRVYNSAFMNMLKKEENAKYRQTIKNVLEFNPEVLKRFVNFMNNPDEKTAVEQFGTQGKYFGACMLMSTMPGLPMFGHGQIEGLHEKYGMEYKRAYWDESVDQGLVRGHEMWIFPLLRLRSLFSGSENFVLYDFQAEAGVDENVFAYSNRRGNQRALVLYHNRYATTAGWIRNSTPIAVKTEGDGTQLRRTTLAAALELEIAPERFYAFRDMTRELEYLRSGQDLQQKGLFAELGEYEFHVFMDFRAISDSDGSWSELCAALNGRGVENLDEERKQVRFAPLNAAFRDILASVTDTPGSDQATPATRVPVPKSSLTRFKSLLAAAAGTVRAPATGTVQDTIRSLAFLASLAEKKPSARDAKAFHAALSEVIDSTRGARLVLAFMVLRGAKAELLEKFGLDCTLRRLVQGSDSAGQQAAAGTAVSLLQALLAFAAESDDWLSWKKDISLESALRLPACREFLLVHEDAGVVWFNKERSEELLAWLCIIRLAALAARLPTVRTVSAWFGAAGRDVRRLTDLAGHAGYRMALYEKLIAPMKGTAKTKKAVETQRNGNTEEISKNTKTKNNPPKKSK